jgi:hypothetical protein
MFLSGRLGGPSETLENGKDAALEQAISKAFTLLSAESTTVVSENQRGLAGKLTEGEKRMTLSEWIEQQDVPIGSENIIQIDRHLAELSQLEADPTDFELRAKAIAREPSSPKRNLLADGLILDLASAIKKARDKVTTLSELTKTKSRAHTSGLVDRRACRRTFEFSVAFGDKADMAFCSAHVCFRGRMIPSLQGHFAA